VLGQVLPNVRNLARLAADARPFFAETACSAKDVIIKVRTSCICPISCQRSERLRMGMRKHNGPRRLCDRRLKSSPAIAPASQSSCFTRVCTGG